MDEEFLSDEETDTLLSAVAVKCSKVGSSVLPHLACVLAPAQPCPNLPVLGKRRHTLSEETDDTSLLTAGSGSHFAANLLVGSVGAMVASSSIGVLLHKVTPSPAGGHLLQRSEIFISSGGQMGSLGTTQVGRLPPSLVF